MTAVSVLSVKEMLIYRISDVVLDAIVLVSRRFEDKRKVLVLKKSCLHYCLYALEKLRLIMLRLRHGHCCSNLKA